MAGHLRHLAYRLAVAAAVAHTTHLLLRVVLVAVAVVTHGGAIAALAVRAMEAALGQSTMRQQQVAAVAVRMALVGQPLPLTVTVALAAQRGRVL